MNKILILITLMFSLYAKDMSKYDEYVNFEYGTGKDKQYIFITPGCPHCDKLVQDIKLFPKLNTYYFFLVPLSQDFYNSKEKIKIILSETRENRFNKLINIQNNTYKLKNKNITNKITNMIKRNRALFESQNGRYVPYVLDSLGDENKKLF